MITTTSPRDGLSRDTSVIPSTSKSTAGLAVQAASAFEQLRTSWDRERRATLLEAIADAIDADRNRLVDIADEETALGCVRLNSEIDRSIGQFRLFAEAVREGSYIEAAIDHAVGTGGLPLPDLRRMLVPLGPVAIFGSSNFPFAFSILGGDTASALAAGCPVLLKAHGSHPLTSQLSMDVIHRALSHVGAPEGVAGIVYGQAAGMDLVRHPEVSAVSLTGSLGAARAIQSAIDERDEPIPFFGELSSVNPMLITEQASRERILDIADGVASSVLGSSGQLCTKPGVIFVPHAAAEQFEAALARRFDAADPAVLLNARIRDSFLQIRDRLIANGGQIRSQGEAGDDDSFAVPPTVVTVDIADFTPALAEECFGPLLVVVRSAGLSDALDAFDSIPGSLTATVHANPAESDLPAIAARLASRAGRVIINGFPTGVRVSWAQHHGGPWPSTNSQHSSVGVTAIRRWLRPVAWQNAPESVLPQELRDGTLLVPTRVDGRLLVPASDAS